MTSLASATNGAQSAQNAYSEALRTSQLESEKLTNASNNVTAARNREQNAALATLEAEDRLSRARKAGSADAEKMLILEEKVAAAKRNEENATIAVERAITAEKTAMKAATAEKERLIASVNNHRLALLREGDAQRNVGAAIRDHNREVRDASNVVDSLGDSLSSMGTRAFKVTRGLGSLAVPAVVEFLIQTAEVAVTASQSIALLPAVAVAAGAGMGTLALATQGFSDAIGDIRDIEKFSQDLAKLAPNAQQTALALRNALPMFDRIQQAAQNAFFSGGSGMITNLAETFGPDIETLTTGIATSLNGAMKSVNANLLSSNGQSDIGSIMDNIAVAFQNAAPAARSFSQVLLDITQVGSSFLPELGTGLANAASDFAAFINEARRSGDLKKWIEEGIAAAKTLGGAILDVGKFLYDTFGGASQSDLNAWRNSLDNLLTTVRIIIEAIGGPMKLLNSEIPTLHKSVSDLVSPFQLIANIIDGFRWFFDPNYRKSTEPLQQAATDKLNARLEELGLPKIAVGGSSAGLGPDDTDPNRFKIPDIAGAPKLGVGTGNVSIADTFMFGGKLYTKDAVKRAQKTSKKNKLSDKEQLDQIAAGLDPNSYKVDPYAPVGGLPAGPMPGGGYGPGAQNAQDVLEAQHSVESQAHDLEESRMKRLALEKSGTATQKEIDDAKWKELEDGWALQKAQANLVDKQRGTTKNLKDGMDSLGVALDPDLGLSQGLSGFAENMTRMLGNMLFAPLEKQLQATINADPLKGGFGLLGINAAKNMSNGLSPLFGQPYGDGTGGAASSAYGSPMAPGGAALPGESARAFAHRVKQPFFESQGYTVGDHAADKYGEHQNGALDIMVPNLAEGSKVLQEVLSDPNTYGAIFNNQTYGYGHGTTPQDYSGGHTGDPSQDHTNHVHAFYKPGGDNNITPLPGGAAAAYGSSAGFSTAGMGGATPVFVVNMPGGGSGGGFPFGSPASGQGSGPAPGPGGGSGFNWDAIAGAEASGNWANKSNPKYQGGLQFDPNTWAKVRPNGAPANAADATREQQIAGAEALLATGATPATQWPATYKAHPEWFQPSGGMPGGTTLPPPGDLFTGGGGQGPIFKKAPIPGGPSDPASPGGAAAANNAMAGFVDETGNILKGLTQFFTDPEARAQAAKDRAPLFGLGGEGAPGVADAWESLAKNVSHWDQWSSNPAGAAGASTADIASMLVGGAGSRGLGRLGDANALSPEALGQAGLPTGRLDRAPAYVGHNIPLNPNSLYRGVNAPSFESLFTDGVMRGRGGGWTDSQLSFMPGYPLDQFVNGTGSKSNIILEGDARMGALSGDALPPEASKQARRGGYGFVDQLNLDDVISGKTPLRAWQRQAPEGSPIEGVHDWKKIFDSFESNINPSGAQFGGEAIGIGASQSRDNADPLSSLMDLFTGGGGQGPIFRKSPMSDLDPNSPTGRTGQGPMPGVPSPFPGLDPTSPFGPLSPGPGQMGPFPTPGALTGLGGVGNSSLLQPGGTGGTAGWTPQGGAPAADPTRIGGVNAGGTPDMGGTGGIGVSDGLMALASTAASGLDLLMPGAGQAAQTGMKLANRAIQYGSQLAGIGVSGLLETFLPSGGSELAGGGWIPRIVGGIAGAKPALPNVAGGKAGNGTNGDPGQGAPPLSPQQAQAHGGGGSPGPGNTNNVNIDYQVQNQTEDRSGKDLESHIMKGLGG